MRWIGLIVAITVVGFVGHSRACGPLPLELLARHAVAPDPARADAAIRSLRTAGPAGLDALLTVHAKATALHREDPAAPDQNWHRIARAVDAVAGQKDAWASGLYWHTDLERAKREAEASGKAVLSLRLLGTLDTEFSCANSRFFRTALYPNAAVQKLLKEKFVLHWQSHRPVPRLTIDFGDGRTIERTITGNSVHYVLTADGRVVDVLPGLYGPAAFARGLGRALEMTAGADRADFASRLAAFHRQRLTELRGAWAADVARVNGGGGNTFVLEPAPPAKARPNAVDAGRLAIAKGRVEMAPAVALLPERAALALEARTDDATWAKIARLHAADAALDGGSWAVIASKNPDDAARANDLTGAKRQAETPLLKLVRNFERSVAEDTVRNEYALHARVHEWFAGGTAPASLDELNERVYAELFLMPRSDPWLGLVPNDTYTGLAENRRQ